MTETRLDQLDATARDLAVRSIAWMDGCWDEAAGLFRVPGDMLYEAGRLGVPAHIVRETAWYALGLLLRDGPGDRARAGHAIETVLTYQFDAPGQPYHGTWYRSPHEPPPPENPVVWRDYDPNWREFIGTTLALVLLEYESRLPAELSRQIDVALRRAIVGTLERNVPASYSNIALMTAFLLQFGADRFGEPAWAAAAERLAAEILARFRAHATFDEYNSPTYYGVDLYALVLWRSYSSSVLLREAGAEIEAALWRDIAQYYHAGMRNVAGPYDRSYGMDMRRYVACLGIWIWLATGYEQAPFPDLGQPLAHGWDFAVAPLVALLGLRMPDDARPHFLAFQGQRQVERVIATEPRRVARAWVGARVMLGAEDSGGQKPADAQFHPATIHWLAAGDAVGWIRLRHTAPVDARAERDRLSIACTEHAGADLEFVFQIAAPDIRTDALQHDSWELPGLTVRVATNTSGPDVTRDGDLAELRYSVRSSPAGAPIHFTLEIEPV
ncbi:MAG: hypothetical protein ACJ8CR_22855 [Roseiflexaceae bacterium]